MAEIGDTEASDPEIWKTPDGVWGNASGGQVYKTLDGGENWELLWDGGIPSSLARYLWINPENTDILYVSTGIFDRGAVNEKDPTIYPDPYGGLGILKSIDGGKTWRVLNEANGLNFLYVNSLFMHPDDPDILLAATGKSETDLTLEYNEKNNIESKMGVYRTTDGGETWTQVLSEGGGASSVEMCPSNPDIVYAGSEVFIYRSEDAGITWTLVAGGGSIKWGPPGVLAGLPIDMQCDPNNPDRVFSNNYVGGNYLSEDGGKTWKNASDGYTGSQSLVVAVDPDNPAQIYVSGRNGIWASSDAGATWYGMRYPPEGLPVWGGEWGGTAIDPSDPEHLLVSEETIWESFDGGASWEVRRSPAYGIALSIVFAPSDNNIVYSGSANPYCLLYLDAQCDNGSGVYISRDGGTTWEFANDPDIENLPLLDLAVNPVDPNEVYAATNQGLYKTTNGGENWTLLTGLQKDIKVTFVTIHSQDYQVVVAGLEHHGLFISTDGGQSWRQIVAGLQPNAALRDILFDPTNPDIVYLSDLSSGVYRSFDGGETWEQINNGLSTRSTTGLAISSDGRHLYVATVGEGAFRLDLNGQPPEILIEETPEPEPTSEPLEEKPVIEPEPTDLPQVEPTYTTTEILDGEAETDGLSGMAGILIGFGLAVGLIALLWLVKMIGWKTGKG